MGTGEFVCVSMTGGAPWGFRLQGGREQKQPLRVAKIRSQSKASGSGLREGDEVVSINGRPCTGLSQPQVVELMESVADSLHLLIKRASSGISETQTPETETRTQQHPPQEGYVESTTLQIQPAPPSQDREPRIVPIKTGVPLAEDQGPGPAFPRSRKEETGLSCPETPHLPAAPEGHSAEELVQPGPVVELQLSLPQGERTGMGVPVVALLGAETSAGPDPDPSLDCGGIAHINSVPSREKGAPPLRSSKIIQIRSGQELRVTQGREAGDAGLPRVEVIFDCADRQQTEGCRLPPAAAGGVDSPGEGGQSEAPPSLVAFAVSSEGTEPGEEPRCGRDHSRPHKHRARHARLRRSESLSEKQVKEAKSRCRSIALLLTAPPSPHSRGVLMFKKLRRRARKFTLISYGTGELGQQEAAGDSWDGRSDSPGEEALLGASESDRDEELLSDSDEDSAHVVTFNWDSALGDVEKKLTREDKMEMLPDTSGKGALMFAKRRERMDQIAAQKEDAAGTVGAGVQVDGLSTGTSYQRTEETTVTRQSCASRSYIEVSPGPGPAPQHNGFGAAPYAAEALRMAPTNRTARPFPGSTTQPAAAFSPPCGWTSPTADFPAPPPYSAVTPPPGVLAQAASSPTAGPAQPPPWPQPAPWSAERIASRDERVSVPAKRTGVLQEARRRGTAKPMFTFKEPKVSPNPELLSLLQSSEGKRGAGPGGDSGPEEDYLSLGAEACNFMQSPSAKQKTPPPVAPKPAVKSSSSQPVTPVSPVWSPGLAPAHPPAFPMATQSQGAIASSTKIAQPLYPPARPASALSLAGPFRGPQAAVASVNYTANTAKPAAPAPAGGAEHVGAAGPPSELPGMQGKGAQLFAKRQSRMEKYVVDSDTVQAHAARAQSPTPSLPPGWKYSSNIRAPPPVAYNPIHSPSYPLAAIKSQPSAPQASKPSKRKGKKPLNALDVMKHQPYQLNASLFTFQPPDAKAGLPQRSSTKVNSVPATKQALPPLAVSASSPANRQASSVSSVPARSPQPAFFLEATSPVSASPVPGGVPSSPKPESASTASFLAPRPKFSAKKSGVAAQESGRSLSLPGRPAPPAIPVTPPWVHRPACSYPPWPSEGLERASKGLAPWEAASQAPLGLADDAFEARNTRESIAATVVSAARRKVLPGPSEDWNDQLPCVLQALRANAGSLGRREYDVAPPPNNRVLPGSQGGSPWSYACSRQLSRTESEMMSLETRSDYCLSVAGGNYNPQPRGWRRQT